jgi:beta-glucosidase
MNETVSAMPLEAKVEALSGFDFWRTAPLATTGIPQVKLSDGPNGARGDLSRYVTAAAFPVGVAVGATWDRELVAEIGEALGREARTKGAHVLLGPTINLQRTPIGGRNFECLSEDPMLTGALAVAYVDGLQSTGVGACPKHFVANDAEIERLTVSCNIDERTLREVYLRPFEMVVRAAQPWMIMAAYNLVNGIQMCSHSDLIEGVLRGEWGFDGVVVSDWGAARDTIGDALGGLDLEMPGPSRTRSAQLVAAVRAGKVPESAIDEKVERLRRLSQLAGAEGNADAPETSVDSSEIRALLRRAAAEAAVLMKNEGDILPLDRGAIRRLAVIGPNARIGQVMGGGSSFVRSHPVSHPLAALTHNLPGIEVVHEPGCSNHKYVPMPEESRLMHPDGGNGLALEHLSGTDASDPVLSSDRHASGKLLFFEEPGRAGEDYIVRLRGSFLPDRGGAHDVGLFSAGPARLYLDDRLVIDNWDSFAPGGSFFGFGSAEIRGQVTLADDGPVAVRIEYLRPAKALIAGLQFGLARPVEDDSISRAVALARDADATVLILGSNSDWETEGEDRATIDLPGQQDELARAVLAVAPDAVIVMNVGAATAMPWYDKARCVLVPWFPGEEFGNALADVLFGAAEPAGRLPFTWPRRIEDHSHFASYPPVDGQLAYTDGLLIGHRWYDRHGHAPLAPFGHGLGFGHPVILGIESDGPGSPSCEVTLRNDGARTSKVNVQVYAESEAPESGDPVRLLVGFAKPVVAPGETIAVTIDISSDAHKSWSATEQRWIETPKRLVAALSSAGPFVR